MLNLLSWSHANHYSGPRWSHVLGRGVTAVWVELWGSDYRDWQFRRTQLAQPAMLNDVCTRLQMDRSRQIAKMPMNGGSWDLPGWLKFTRTLIKFDHWESNVTLSCPNGHVNRGICVATRLPLRSMGFLLPDWEDMWKINEACWDFWMFVVHVEDGSSHFISCHFQYFKLIWNKARGQVPFPVHAMFQIWNRARGYG